VLAAQSNLRFEQKRCLFPKNSELDSVFLGQSINNLYFCSRINRIDVAFMKSQIGIQNFDEVRRDGYAYVDKTALMYKMVSKLIDD